MQAEADSYESVRSTVKTVSPSADWPRVMSGETFIGPETGHLVIVGGNAQSSTIFRRIIELAGGPDSPVVVIPTAGGDPTYDDQYPAAVRFRDLGASNVVVLHTYDRNVADTDEFVTPLLEARGIFFGGGRQWRLVDAYGGTKTEDALQRVLDRGGVISGTSAGATIQGSFLTRGDTENNQIMVGNHAKGFGYLKDTAIDQHVLARNRHFDMMQILREHPHLLGLGIDEDTALVVSQNRGDVLGSSYCVIYDGKYWSEEGGDLKKLPSAANLFYFLKEGDGYDLKARRVLSDRVSSG